MLKIGFTLIAQKYLRKVSFSWEAINCFKKVEAIKHWDFKRTFETPSPPLVLSWYTTSRFIGFNFDFHRYLNISLFIKLEYFLGRGYVWATYQTFDKIRLFISIALWYSVNFLKESNLVITLIFERILFQVISMAKFISLQNVIPKTVISDLSVFKSTIGYSMQSFHSPNSIILVF